MRPGFEIPEELLEDYYGGDVDETEEEEVDEELLEDYYDRDVDEGKDKGTQTEVKKEGDSAQEEILVKEKEDSEFFETSHATSLAEPTGRNDNSTDEVTLGRVPLPNGMIFWKNSKQPLTLIFGKLCCNFFIMDLFISFISFI